jgi:hypothetical protein
MMDGWNNGFKSVKIEIAGSYLMGSPIFQHSSIPIFHYSMGMAKRVTALKYTATFASLQRLRNFNWEM